MFSITAIEKVAEAAFYCINSDDKNIAYMKRTDTHKIR